ncbi:MAG: class I tRNA ligase family protein, partial [Actinomycetota bacterium]
FTSWIDGLNGDWLISRQRFFGVPIPLWYPLDPAGEPMWDQPLVPSEDQLPIDPSTDVPAGYEESQRGQAGGFMGEPDIMDTWATSSLTPQIATGWRTDEQLYAATFPMDVRPQAHDIIRTWLFSTVVRAHFDADTVPWKNCALSGWILDPDRKKMSKSKGNVVVPTDLLEQYGSDAVRYWASSGRPGTDTAFDEGQMKIGRRLSIKLLNASKFVLGFGDPGEGIDPTKVTEALDQAMLDRLADLVDDATHAFEAFDYARSLERTETFFWWFTDNYMELVKARAYGEYGDDRAASAHHALRMALSTLHRLFAPFLPFVTEEVWNWWQDGSIHRAAWPAAAELRTGFGSAAIDVATNALIAVRREKSEANRKLRTAVIEARFSAPADQLALLDQVIDDVKAAGVIQAVGPHTAVDTNDLAVAADLEPEPPTTDLG